MTNPIDITNFAFADAGFVVAALGFLLNIFIPYTKPIYKRFFAVIFALLMLYVASDIASQITLAVLGKDYATLSQVAIFFESLFSSIIMPILTAYLLYSAGRLKLLSPPIFVISGLWLIYFILLCSTWFSDKIYYITEDNVYHRGPYYPILLVPVILMTAFNIVLVILNKKNLSKKQYAAFSIYFTIPLVCMIIQMLTYGLLLIVIGTSIATMIMFLFIVLDQISLYIDQKEKNAHAYAANMALQMRPHFIYNVMMSIYYLCQQDPKKAQQVTLNFTNYLRRNFTAIAKEGTIPFTEELKHTKAYLEVEKARFEGTLFTNFDIPHKMFRVPPLVLQPIVENAVKHGVDPELDPLTILISTKKTETGSVITVLDTGIGYTESDNDDPHVALDNIRTRLDMACHGTLTIKPVNTGGTKAEIFIPDSTSVDS